MLSHNQPFQSTIFLSSGYYATLESRRLLPRRTNTCRLTMRGPQISEWLVTACGARTAGAFRWGSSTRCRIWRLSLHLPLCDQLLLLPDNNQTCGAPQFCSYFFIKKRKQFCKYIFSSPLIHHLVYIFRRLVVCAGPLNCNLAYINKLYKQQQ